MNILKKEEGIAFAATAIIIAVVLGMVTLYLMNSVTLNISEAADVYSAEQAYWSAVSGIEYAMLKSADNIHSIPGSYSFFNSGVELSLSYSDHTGTPLPNDKVRIISHARFTQSIRIIEVTLKLRIQNIWPKLSIIEMVDGDELEIEEEFTLNDSVYIGGNVEVDEEASIGDPPDDRTHIYVPPGKGVVGEFDANFSWSQYPDGWLSLPSFSTEDYNELLQIAESINVSMGNRHHGNYKVDGGTFDLSGFENNTFFVKGKFEVKGATVIGGTLLNPGIIVATKQIEIHHKGLIQSNIADNIIFITGDEVKIKDKTQFGHNYSSIPPALRPKIVNEIFAKKDIEINNGTNVWAQVISMHGIEVKGILYGLIYSTGKLEFEDENSYFEGALFVRKIEHELEEGKINLNHSIPVHYFSGIKYQVVPSSFREI